MGRTAAPGLEQCRRLLPEGEAAMRGVMGLLGLVMTMAIGLFIYRSYFTANEGALTMGTNNPRAVADVTGVKMDLNNMAQAERAFLALNGHYGSLEELQSAGQLSMDPSRGRQGYAYSADVGERNFTITATYSGPATGMPTLFIDETMQIAQH
jgi:hypothetical protein